MLKQINKIKGFGVYSDYIKPSDIAEFGQKNIIYGWNYSGKTTLSRLFSSIENKSIHPDYYGAKFNFESEDGTITSDENLISSSLKVRVFNSDFVEKNIEWNGSSFNPILLLGEDTIEAEKEIEKNNNKIEKCNIGYRMKESSSSSIDTTIANLKKDAAKEIKQTLHLVESFTATHLDKVLDLLPLPYENHLIESEEISKLLKIALSSEKDKLNVISRTTIDFRLVNYSVRANKLIQKTPEFSSTIDYLRVNPAISDWVEKGIPINQNKENCEFCGNEIDQERMNELSSHFSKDLKEYKRSLESLINDSGNTKISYNSRSDMEFYPEFRDEHKKISSKISSFTDKYNESIDCIFKKLSEKCASPFGNVSDVSEEYPVIDDIQICLKELNNLIDRCNERTENFSEEKTSAIQKLKLHYSADFYIKRNIESKSKKSHISKIHKKRYTKLRKSLIEANKIREASISKAQKGREELNEYITGFLGRDEIQIEVVKEGQAERFKLMRDGSVAKNLSEGEKTAIAFSFFLTKLRENKDMDKLIVYIDDPISSLDSNHIFQINAVIKDFFFKKEITNGGKNEEWKLKCKQIFISTHNFEFLSLLKELPINRKKSSYYQVKRLKEKKSSFNNLPKSIEMYSSEYHYLFGIIHKFHLSADKTDLDVLLSLPNAVRRFVELYTYSRIPSFSNATVDQRAEKLFGAQESKRLLKVLHYFSHVNSIERLANNSDLVCDIETAVIEIMDHLKKDTLHYDALIESVQ